MNFEFAVKSSDCGQCDFLAIIAVRWSFVIGVYVCTVCRPAAQWLEYVQFTAGAMLYTL